VKAGLDKLDEDLSQRVCIARDTEEVIEEFQEVFDKACKSSYRLNRTTKKETSQNRPMLNAKSRRSLEKRLTPKGFSVLNGTMCYENGKNNT
jgi:hypothetical protein